MKQLTEEDAVNVWLRHWQGEYQHVTAAYFKVNQGRINEVLKRKRFPCSYETAKNSEMGRFLLKAASK